MIALLHVAIWLYAISVGVFLWRGAAVFRDEPHYSDEIRAHGLSPFAVLLTVSIGWPFIAFQIWMDAR